VADGQWAYFASWREWPTKSPGNCLFRAPLDEVDGSWLALRDSRFSQSFPDPYRVAPEATADADCDVIGRATLRGPLRSIVRLERQGLWMGLFQYTPPAKESRQPSGIFASYSQDLIDWSPAQLIFSSRQPWGQSACQKFYDYPSVIDHDSPSRVFASAGASAHLYLTRFNYEGCVRGLDRDLVRVELLIGSD
jgi:hypothetical protein